MALTMYVNDDPNASLGLALLMAALAVGRLAPAAFVARPLFSRASANEARND
jgi:hypothetical protein